MSATYNDVLMRLNEERVRLTLSQNEMTRIVHMTQSNYSKVEQGLRRLSYNELKCLCDSEIDIYYVFTGYRSEGKYTELLLKCDYSELCSYLSIIYSVAVLRQNKCTTECWSSILERVRYVPLITGNHKSKNIFLAIRHSMNLQQKKIAEALGVDIKKYRDLEKGRSLPDSELLWRLYHSFHISPVVLLKDKNGLIHEISSLLEAAEADNENIISEIVKRLQEMDSLGEKN